MKLTPRALRILALFAILPFSASCIKSPSPSLPPQPPAQQQQSSCIEPEKSNPSVDTAVESGQSSQQPTCVDARTLQESERNRAACYHLQPGATVTKKKGHRSTGHGAKVTKKKGRKAAGTKAVATKKKGKQKTGSATVISQKEEYQTTGMCQPQSLIYARCRTGIKTCTMGNTSPVQWFACAKKNGYATSTPIAGSVLVLDGNSRRKMTTGHPVYVEEVKANNNGTWTLRITHTNYDRKCHLDLDATVLFDPKHMIASFQSGPWSSWAKDLKVLGFILR